MLDFMYRPLKFNSKSPWKTMVRRHAFPFWDGKIFGGELLNIQGVSQIFI